MITFKNVSKCYAENRIALDNISITIERGSIVSVIGPSGAGKTTLIRCINGLTACTSGSVEISGTPVNTKHRHSLRKLRKNIGMIFQNYNLVEQLTVLENTLHGCLGSMPFYRSIPGLYSAAEKEAAFTILEDMEMADYAYQRCTDLSGGQKQRIGIARALMQKPEILLCDEPVSSLDPKNAQDILEYLNKVIKKNNLTCVMNLHHIEYAKRYSDRIVGLRSGTLVFDGTPDMLSHAALGRIFSPDAGIKKEV
ncbi:MAG: phosphonate ABC transporter ATP-binding protein [Treponema sp.]